MAEFLDGGVQAVFEINKRVALPEALKDVNEAIKIDPKLGAFFFLQPFRLCW